MESLVDLGEAEEADEDDEEDESSEVSSRYGGSSKELSSPQEATLVPGDCLHSTPFRAEVPPPLRQGELTGPSYGVQEGPRTQIRRGGTLLEGRLGEAYIRRRRGGKSSAIRNWFAKAELRECNHAISRFSIGSAC